MTLLERESQLGSLLQYADEARDRSGRLVLISGEAGVGKSSLVEELQQRLPEATWAWGACDSLFTPRPLAAVHDIARELGGNLLEMVQGAASRDEIFDAVLHCASVTDGLAVLVVEDVQWADEATLDLLRFLARRVAKLPVLLLVTFRDDALAPSDPLRVAIGELAGQRYTRRIDLPPLSAAGVRRLAEGSSYSPVELYELTGGNPFFVVEVLSDGGVEIPASARDAVLARAARLSDRAAHDAGPGLPRLLAGGPRPGGPRRRSRARDLRRAGRGRADAGRGRRPCGSATSSRDVPSSPRCRLTGRRLGTRRCYGR